MTTDNSRADALTDADRNLLARINDCTKLVSAADRNGVIQLIERIAASPVERPRTHTTQPGESVAGIALRQCGNEDQWRSIIALNPEFSDHTACDYFPVGTVLTLPARPIEQHEAASAGKVREIIADARGAIRLGNYELAHAKMGQLLGDEVSDAVLAARVDTALLSAAPREDTGNGAEFDAWLRIERARRCDFDANAGSWARAAWQAHAALTTVPSDDQVAGLGIDACIEALVEAKTLAEKFRARNQLDLAINREVSVRAPRTEVAGAVPHNILVSLECAALWLENGCDAEMAATEIRMAIEKLRALQPPSADAAAAPADEPSELEQVIECLGDDAATLRHSDEYVEMADNMEAAARLLESFAEDRAAEQICNRWPWQREASQDAAPSDAQAVEAVAIRDPNYVGGVKLLRDLPPQTKLYAAPQPHAQEVAQVRLTDERAYRMYEAAMSAMEASGPYQTVEAATAAVVRNLFAAPASAPVGPTDAQIKALTDKWAARWGTSSAWNIRRCIDNALREALALLKGDKQ